MKKPNKIPKIPKSPVKEKKDYKRKVRRSWKRHPATQVTPNTKKKKEDKWEWGSAEEE